jgi:hypothetical protein
MRPTPFSLLAAACALTLASCADKSPTAVTLDRLTEIRSQSAPKGMVVKTTLRLRQHGNVMTTPSLIQRPGDSGKIEMIRDFAYPTEYDLPRVDGRTARQVSQAIAGKESPQAFPVTPTTPRQFKTEPVGITISLKPVLDGGLVLLSGEVMLREFDGFTRAPGEAVSPIILSKDKPIPLTENVVNLPMFREARTPLFVTALPGQTYKMRVAGIDSPINLEVTCELVADETRKASVAARQIPKTVGAE